MNIDRTSEWQALKKWTQLVVAGISVLVALVSFAAEYLSPKSGLLPFGTAEVITLLIPLGLVAGLFHGVLWSSAEKLFRWKFGAGGSGHLPSGLSAIVLSVTLTLPVAFVPLLFQRVATHQLLPTDYVRGVFGLVVAGCLSHLIMYGLGPRVPGLRQSLMPIDKPTTLVRAVLTEVTYAVVYFGLMGVTYRVLSVSPVAWPDAITTGKVAASALIFILGMAIFIGARFPESLEDPTWIQVRGFFSGAFLPICLTTAMFA